MNITLRHLKLEDRDQFYKAINSNWDGFSFVHYWESVAQENFEKYVEILPGFSKGLHIPNEHIPCTFLFAFNENEEIVGRTSIRHELTEQLLKEGGHIGYAVLPEFRKKGYATLILKESLNYIKDQLRSINKVLVTCDEDNIASQKTIEKNNGELENILTLANGKKKRRYWIQI